MAEGGPRRLGGGPGALRRGIKAICKFFPNEAADLEPVVQLLGGLGPAQWEAQCVLLVWLYQLVLLPFHLALLDSSLSDAPPSSTCAPSWAPLPCCSWLQASDGGVMKVNARSAGGEGGPRIGGWKQGMQGGEGGRQGMGEEKGGSKGCRGGRRGGGEGWKWGGRGGGKGWKRGRVEARDGGGEGWKQRMEEGGGRQEGRKRIRKAGRGFERHGAIRGEDGGRQGRRLREEERRKERKREG